MKTLNNILVPKEAKKLYYTSYVSCDCGCGGYDIPVLITDNVKKLKTYVSYYYTDEKGSFNMIKNPILEKIKN